MLIDFDAARLYKPEEDTDTPDPGHHRLPPQVVRPVQTDQRADIFAVGVLINVMLSAGSTPQAAGPGHLRPIVARCTQVNPKNRYSDVLRLMEVL